MEVLNAFQANQRREIKWDEISQSMRGQGLAKSAKQCRERWTHHLNPLLINERFTEVENQLLMTLQSSHGSHWKDISSHFPGRTDNQVKNQFFSLVRKLFRKACKVLGIGGNTALINKIKPKVLTEFINLPLDFEGSVLPVEINADQSPYTIKQFLTNCLRRKPLESKETMPIDQKKLLARCIDKLQEHKLIN